MFITIDLVNKENLPIGYIRILEGVKIEEEIKKVCDISGYTFVDLKVG